MRSESNWTALEAAATRSASRLPGTALNSQVPEGTKLTRSFIASVAFQGIAALSAMSLCNGGAA